MSERVCLVHYHEIGLKGKNRSIFENQLVTNLKCALRDTPLKCVKRICGYILVTFEGGATRDCQDLIGKVPGVARVSLAHECPRDLAEYSQAAIVSLGEAGSFSTFKVHAHKSSTDYPVHTLDINRQVGAALCEAFPDKKVDVHNPDVTVHVNVVQGSVYIYAVSERGAGGLPVGTAGKVVTLLSSGFDSPVATWMLGRRGAICVPIHFSGRPMVSDTSEWLTQDIVKALAPSGVVGRLYVVPFGARQREISLAVDQKLRIITYRRVMFSVAERIARIEGAKALVTGESLGQVASQTLENIAAVDETVSMPVLRPLIGSDKQEIIERAQQIGTYDISCQTAPDCCTLFMPRRPETHAKRDEVHEAWDSFDHEAMIEDLVDHIEYVDFDQCPSYRPPRKLRVRHEELAPAEWEKKGIVSEG
ncbi:MAG: tRNA 4-thiouridine(8) synthase ThiI [Atopobiaceae bacterium]|jgi:thiamine biosynthesis protein ThiI|nr:tRNA 4-thiouridine(8) synthase ThiI [Atopobium sp.]MCH4081272.1 tRNA 4-thiouridine(8) synthase ThiI [Atopobiaceae bacterium]MCI1344197.1 tRNA 4-thiouridine(8) synthase ThiI [Atopobiaceae bacterium]MCI1497282.1 tRNA 4-thiouridine(8) synthase ThiI [Atopobiaceae bacterium]MCI1538958.1 tRNA 4-thiouridine(8) synthase ThiI [Atopobiaceae bacterium]